jgi:hypothetical protein
MLFNTTLSLVNHLYWGWMLWGILNDICPFFSTSLLKALLLSLAMGRFTYCTQLQPAMGWPQVASSPVCSSPDNTSEQALKVSFG